MLLLKMRKRNLRKQRWKSITQLLQFLIKGPPPCSPADDEVGSFGKYIVETFKRFNPLQRTVARKKTSDVLFDVEMESAPPPTIPVNRSRILSYKTNADLTITSTVRHPTASATCNSPWQTHTRQDGICQLINEVRDLFINLGKKHYCISSIKFIPLLSHPK
jgi:hypothetical protein